MSFRFTGRDDYIHTDSTVALQTGHSTSHFGPPPPPPHTPPPLPAATTTATTPPQLLKQGEINFKLKDAMVGLAAPSFSPGRPRYRSHSVAYGADCTLRTEDHTTTTTDATPSAPREILTAEDKSQAAIAMPPPPPSPPTLASTSLPSDPRVFLSPLRPPEQQGWWRSAPGTNAKQIHPQNSFGFSFTPSQPFRMLRRCESLGFDGSGEGAVSEPHPLPQTPGQNGGPPPPPPSSSSSSPSSRERCRGSLRQTATSGVGKWRRSGSQSSLIRREAFRSKPLRRTNSRTGGAPDSGSGADADHPPGSSGSTLTGSDGSGSEAGAPPGPSIIPPAPQQRGPPKSPSVSPSPSPSPERRRHSRRRSHRQASTSTAVPAAPGAADADGYYAGDDDDDDDDGVDNDDAFEAESAGREKTTDRAHEEVGDRRKERSPRTPPPPPQFPTESPKTRRVDMNTIDPFQVFEVNHLPCIILQVRVVRGRNITNGWLQDRFDTPDPYVKLRIKTAPEGRRRTRTIDDNVNPLWNEAFTFCLPYNEVNVLELTLMEANPLNLDQVVGTVTFNIESMTFNQWQSEVFNFSGVEGVSEIDVDFHVNWDQNPTLRYSLCLSDAEKDFIKKRKEKVWQALRKLLGDRGPQSAQEAPTIAVIGSGGGFRAMTGYSGVFKALVDTGLLDCATYACGLSGSSWYLSTLYSHPRWPEMKPGEMQSELMRNIDKSLYRLLGLKSVLRYLNSVLSKRREGQPVSFTDFFGHLVGETLLQGRLDSKLTDQRVKIKDGDVPLPLYTCVHVKKDVPARSFQEWVEFSPYEVGMPKYGTFLDSELFGSKFFMGKLVRQYKEPPLHFLQGIWGSAFCILFKRLLEDNRNLDPAEMIRQEMGRQLEEQQEQDEDSSDLSDDSDNDDDDTESDVSESEGAVPNKKRGSREETPPEGRGGSQEAERGTPPRRRSSVATPSFKNKDRLLVVSDESSDRETSDSSDGSFLEPPACFLKAHDSSEGFDDNDDDEDAPSTPKTPVPREAGSQAFDEAGYLSSSPKKEVRFSKQVDRYEKQKKKTKNGRNPALRRAPSVRRGKSGSYWKSVLTGIFENQKFELLNTRAGRAAVIHNFMRGLNLQQTYPLSPFTPLHERVQDGDEFDGIFEMHPTHIKHIYVVDAGLTFNSPYPLVMRPQREVDIILSFDFSGRPSDATPPFKELLLAEKWAKVNRLPFPPIDPTVVDREGLKELYVFQDPEDPHCPVVLHFPLVNISFRKYKAPGVPRKTKDEVDFADFDIFDDPALPYSTFNFTYTHQQFQRLSQLTEFNTLYTMERVKQVLAEAVARKRQAAPRVPVQSRDFKLLRMKSVTERRHLKKVLQRVESRWKMAPPPTPSWTGSGSTTPTATPFLTPSPSPNSGNRRAQERNPFTFMTSSSSGSSGSAQEGQNPFFNASEPRKSQASVSSTSSSFYDALTPPNSSGPSPSSPCKGSSQPQTKFAFPLSNGSGSPQNCGDDGHLKHSTQDSRTDARSPAARSLSNPRIINNNNNNNNSTHCAPEHTSEGKNAQTDSKTSVRRRAPVRLNKQPNSIVSDPSSPRLPHTTSSPRGTHPETPEEASRHSFSNHSTTQPPPAQSSSNPDRSQQQHRVSSNGAQSDCNTSSDCRRQRSVRTSQGSSTSEDEFYDAPEAFRKDGTPVTDRAEASKHHQGAKDKRKLLRRQSTITSLSSSITASVSLDDVEYNPEDSLRTSQSSSTTMDIDNLDQFQGTADDSDSGDNGDIEADEEPFFDTSHRGSLVSKEVS